MNYYECEIAVTTSGNSDEAYWICIRGVRKPSVEEASEFLRSDEEMYGGKVVGVYPIDLAVARDCYDFECEDNWPVFGANESEV